MKPWMRYSLFFLFLLGVWIVLGFVEDEQEQRVVGIPDIEIKLFEDMKFLSEEAVILRLKDKQLVGEDKVYSELELEKIEDALIAMPEVKTAQAYTYLSGKWKIEMSLRQPIARIFNIDGSSCYLDKSGKLMPLSDNYTAHVITVDGNINETDYLKSVDDIINNDSLITIEILDDLYEISNYVCSDEFLSAQFTHIHINEYNEFELIPRVGDQRIMFGKAKYIAGKFKKLEHFYNEGLSRAGWEMYDTINVMYKNQVVCSKRN
jgi:cell division protein FtsQ